MRPLLHLAGLAAPRTALHGPEDPVADLRAFRGRLFGHLPHVAGDRVRKVHEGKVISDAATISYVCTSIPEFIFELSCKECSKLHVIYRNSFK